MEPFRVTGTADKGTRMSLPIILMIPVLVAMLALMFALTFQMLRSDLFMLVFWLTMISLFLVFEAAFVKRYLTARRPKTFEIDDKGIRLHDRKRTLWNLSWSDLSSVRTTFPGSKSFTGIIIRAGDRSYRLDNTEHLGPRIKLVEAYRVLSEEAKRRNIPTWDLRGWSANLMSQDERERGKVAFEGLKGKWIHSSEPTGIDRTLLRAGAALATPGLAIIVAVHLLSASKYFYLLGGMIAVLGCFMFVFAYVVMIDTIAAIKFDDGSLTVRLSNRKVFEMQWAEILQVRTNPGSSYLGILPKGGFGWNGSFTEQATLAVKARFIEAYEKQYDMIATHEISMDGMDIGFQDGRKEHISWKDISAISPKGADPFCLKVRNGPVLRFSPLDREIAVGILDSYEKYNKARRLHVSSTGH